VNIQTNPVGKLGKLTLGNTLDGVSGSFTPALDGQSASLDLNAETDAAQGEQRVTVSLENAGKTLTAELKLNVTVRAAATFFIDPVAGLDTNDGSQAKPFKTLTLALGRARAGDIVHLNKGEYSSANNGERFGKSGLDVPSGVKIIGTLEGALKVSNIKGVTGETGLHLLGDATLENFIIERFDTAIRAEAGQQTIRNVPIHSNFGNS
jgi:hypothetical protein